MFNTAYVHHTRVIPVHGIQVPYSQESFIPAEYRYWGFSVLQRVVDCLKNNGSVFASLSQLLQEVSVGKYKFKELANIVSSTDGVKILQRRIQAMDVMKSAFHSIVMDNEEDFIRDNVSFSGIADVLYQFFMLICASTGYPMTKLFGISPAVAMAVFTITAEAPISIAWQAWDGLPMPASTTIGKFNSSTKI